MPRARIGNRGAAVPTRGSLRDVAPLRFSESTLTPPPGGAQVPGQKRERYRETHYRYAHDPFLDQHGSDGGRPARARNSPRERDATQRNATQRERKRDRARRKPRTMERRDQAGALRTTGRPHGVRPRWRDDAGSRKRPSTMRSEPPWWRPRPEGSSVSNWRARLRVTRTRRRRNESSTGVAPRAAELPWPEADRSSGPNHRSSNVAAVATASVRSDASSEAAGRDGRRGRFAPSRSFDPFERRAGRGGPARIRTEDQGIMSPLH